MLKKLLSAIFPNRPAIVESSSTRAGDASASLLVEVLSPSQKANYVGEELGVYPLLDAIKVLVDDIIARFPLPPGVRYPGSDDDEYDYECAEAVAIRSKYNGVRVAALRAQAQAARKAAANQSGKGGTQIATALTEWAAAIETGAQAVERSYELEG